MSIEDLDIAELRLLLLARENEIERLRVEIAQWKDRFECERADHEHTIKQMNDMYGTGP